jgi:hypothetical protein
MDHITMILVISPILFVLVYWCWSSLMSADAQGSGKADRINAPDAPRELQPAHEPALVYVEAQSKPLAR